MTTVYVVTQGEYSDYRIMSVFSTRERAERFVEVVSDRADDPTIEEYQLDDASEAFLRGEEAVFYVIFKPGSADANNIRKTTQTRSGDEGGNALGGYWCEVVARDEQHAAKIAMEKRAVWLANREQS